MILDACCGALSMYHGWHKKLGDTFVYIDTRTQEQHDYGKHTRYPKVIPAIKPLIKADMRHLPFRNGTFSTIIADPPHLDFGLKAFMGQRYGSWNVKQIVQTVRAANTEFRRVLKPGGALLLKIMNARLTLYEALLSNFTFYLPIEYKSQSHLSKKKVGWYIATLRAASPTQPSPSDTELPKRQDQLKPHSKQRQAHQHPSNQQLLPSFS